MVNADMVHNIEEGNIDEKLRQKASEFNEKYNSVAPHKRRMGVTLILTLDSVPPFEGNDVPRQRH